MRVAHLAGLSIARRPFTSVLAALCVALAVLACSLFVTVAAGRTADYDHLQTDFDLIIGPKSSGLELLLGALGVDDPPRDVIPYALASAILRRTQPVHWLPLLDFGRSDGARVFGTNAQYFARPEGMAAPVFIAGQPFPAAAGGGGMGPADEADLAQAVIGAGVARRRGLGVGDRLTITGSWRETDSAETWRREVTVAGVIDHGGTALDEAIFTGLALGWDHYRWALTRNLVRDTQRREAATYVLLAVTEEQAAVVRTTIHNNSVAQLAETREELAFLERLLAGTRWATRALCVCVLLLVCMVMGVLANLRYESLRPELALLRAMGYPRRAVMACLALEILAIALAGILLAVAAEAVLVGVLDLPAGLGLTPAAAPWPAAWNGAVWAGGLAAAAGALLSALGRLYRAPVQSLMRGL